MSSASFAAYWTASVLPPNSTRWELAVEATCAAIVSLDPVHLIADARSDQDCPTAWLPYLAVERAVDEWDSGWTEAQRRAVVAGSFEYHRHQGTRRALDLALSPLGYNLKTVEWFEATPSLDPYTFTIAIKIGQDETWLASDFRQLVRIANRAKNAHTKLVAVEPSREWSTGLFSGGVPKIRRSLIVTKSEPFVKVETLLSTPYARVAAALLRTRRVIIHPRSIQ